MAKGGESNIHSTVMQQILESEVAQLCPTLHDPMDCSLPGSSVHGIFQASELEWGAIAIMSNSFETPWTVAHQAPVSMGFSRQEYWSGVPLHSSSAHCLIGLFAFV